MDERNQFLNNFREGKISNILYTYHKEMSKNILSTAQFSMQLQTLSTLQMMPDKFGNPIFNFQGFKDFVVRHYMIKYTVYKMFDKQNQLIDVY